MGCTVTYGTRDPSALLGMACGGSRSGSKNEWGRSAQNPRHPERSPQAESRDLLFEAENGH
jgi:hypothetical protein